MLYDNYNILRIQKGMYENAISLVDAALAKNYYNKKVEELKSQLSKYSGNNE